MAKFRELLLCQVGCLCVRTHSNPVSSILHFHPSALQAAGSGFLTLPPSCGFWAYRTGAEPRLCTILHTNFRERLFHALG
jgi:hypothetical protein